MNNEKDIQQTNMNRDRLNEGTKTDMNKDVNKDVKTNVDQKQNVKPAVNKDLTRDEDEIEETTRENEFSSQTVKNPEDMVVNEKDEDLALDQEGAIRHGKTKAA